MSTGAINLQHWRHIYCAMILAKIPTNLDKTQFHATESDTSGQVCGYFMYTQAPGKTPKPSWYPVSRPSNSSCMTIVMEFINTSAAVTFLAQCAEGQIFTPIGVIIWGPRVLVSDGSQRLIFDPWDQYMYIKAKEKSKWSDANARRLHVLCQVTAPFLKGPCHQMT